MINFIKNAALRLRKDEKGVTLVEYGIALTLAVGLGAGALTTLGDDVGGMMGAASGQLVVPAN
ncbi:Flp family type IVb pilin [Seohaeicola zhoushanensis]|uniref:Flp family type IVb pilin n=1 Tax=Seohaeicola zhoushanensis TaxID=1569283 RepID=A0A8J3H036_9RHOB|nr:Flp family type IVb pilin [Seohaeicola zhoushanensis]GHF58942.1 hypothetical protein GCM10017056_32980 [Seohaeicola zhoushanensis]